MAMSSAPVSPERRQPHSAKPPSTPEQTKNGTNDADEKSQPMAHGTPPAAKSDRYWIGNGLSVVWPFLTTP